uniref:Small nuclear ribonucleoprotein E n=1 Tax=Fundulus heteroclitus TaxID=8078 RepID=A0A3Q2QXW8_FUNHE
MAVLFTVAKAIIGKPPIESANKQKNKARLFRNISSQHLLSDLFLFNYVYIIMSVLVNLDSMFQNLIFRYLQNRSRIQVWLYEQVNMRIEGCIIGFDEYMNLVLDDAEEIHMKTKNRKPLGRIMLKGDNITLLQSVSN